MRLISRKNTRLTLREKPGHSQSNVLAPRFAFCTTAAAVELISISLRNQRNEKLQDETLLSIRKTTKTK